MDNNYSFRLCGYSF